MDIFDEEGHSPLHKAVMYNQLESVQALAMNGVNLNIKDASGNTSLHVSEANRFRAMVDSEDAYSLGS